MLSNMLSMSALSSLTFQRRPVSWEAFHLLMHLLRHGQGHAQDGTQQPISANTWKAVSAQELINYLSIINA